MNLLADNLFALLLGWTRSLFNSLWNLITNNGSGFSDFLHRFWLPLLIALLLVGSFFDLLIWLIRWRPYYVWSTRQRMRANRRRLKRTASYMEDLDHSPLDLPEYRQNSQEANHELPDEPVCFDFGPYDFQEQGDYQPAEATGNDDPFDVRPVYEAPFVPDLPWQAIQASPSVQEGIGYGEEPARYGLHTPENTPTCGGEAFVPPGTGHDTFLDHFQASDRLIAPLQSETSKSNGSSRRRRTETHRQRVNVFKSIRDTFFTSQENEPPIDSIRPPRTQEDSFHKPFYPQNYSYKDQSVQMPPQDSDNP